MGIKLPLKNEQKLTVVCRIEAGCLGPDGDDHVDEFCAFGQPHVEPIDADFVLWKIVPRLDKTLPEMHYSINGKVLDHTKAEKYLGLFGKDLNAFEEHLHDKIAQIIDDYLDGRKKS